MLPAKLPVFQASNPRKDSHVWVIKSPCLVGRTPLGVAPKMTQTAQMTGRSRTSAPQQRDSRCATFAPELFDQGPEILKQRVAATQKNAALKSTKMACFRLRGL